MRILPEALSLYVIETTTYPLARNRVAEPVGAYSSIDNALPQSTSNKQSVKKQNESESGNIKRDNRSEKERRKDDRRKNARPILLDTRMSKSRRKPTGYTTISFEI